MPTWLLYCLAVMAWGTSWYAITLHLDAAPLFLSIGYRFVLASALLFLFLVARRRSLALPKSLRQLVLIQALSLFCINYWLFYGAQTYIPSAFAAVIFSSVILVNALNTRIWRKEPTSKGVIIGGIMGIGGLSLVFLPALSNLALDNGVVLGLGLGILGTFTASIGNVAAANLKDLGGKLVLTNAWGMLIGGCVTLSVHALLGGEWVFPTDAGYWLPLVYLVTVSSIIGFGSYLSLIGRLGPARAASTSVVFPLVAFVPSIVFEGVAVSTELVIGVALVLGGNTLVLWERHRANRKNTPRQRD